MFVRFRPDVNGVAFGIRGVKIESSFHFQYHKLGVRLISSHANFTMADFESDYIVYLEAKD